MLEPQLEIILKDYVELLEAEEFLDARHVKFLALAKEELQRLKIFLNIKERKK